MSTDCVYVDCSAITIERILRQSRDEFVLGKNAIVIYCVAVAINFYDYSKNWNFKIVKPNAYLTCCSKSHNDQQAEYKSNDVP